MIWRAFILVAFSPTWTAAELASLFSLASHVCPASSPLWKAGNVGSFVSKHETELQDTRYSVNWSFRSCHLMTCQSQKNQRSDCGLTARDWMVCFWHCGREAVLCIEKWWWFIISFVRSFVIAGRGPAYSGPQRWDLYGGPMRQPRERTGICRCVRCMCELCRVEEGLSRREQLVRYF